ncbi:MAG TPA: hypothetical protein VJT73_01230 [Polyangiaceae bacterium]|nr:hypothetical protein [Polyangiaceae bacterium]HKY35572.1 hypothetical protein [Polyangiaceae bacterium]
MPSISIEGIYYDRLIDPHGSVIRDFGWRKNLIVLRCRVLLGAFLKNDGAALGIQSLAVGRGDPSWDTAPPPLADPATTTALFDVSPFVIPVADLTLDYLDDSESIVPGPTHRVQVTSVLGPNQPTPSGSPPYPLREFGLFGSFGATPFMIDYIRHPLIEKDGAVTLERKVRLFL